MALVTQMIDVPFTGGLREDVDPRVLPPGSLLTADNAVFEQQGGVGRRLGYSVIAASIDPSGTLTTPEVVAAPRGYDLLAVSTAGGAAPIVHSWSPNQNEWEPKDEAPMAIVTRERFAESAGGAYHTQVVVFGNYLGFFWAFEDTSGNKNVYYRVVDATTRAVLVDETLLISGDCMGYRAFACGTTLMCAYQLIGDAVIIAKYNFSADTWSTGIVSAAGATYAISGVDAAAISSTECVVCYIDNAQDAVWKKITVSSLAVATTVTETATATQIAVYADSTTVVMAWCEQVASDVSVRKYNTSGTASFATCALTTTSTVTTSGIYAVTCAKTNSGGCVVAVSGLFDTSVFLCNSSGTNVWVAADGRTIADATIASKMFVHGTRVYGFMAHYSGYTTYNSAVGGANVADGQQTATNVLVCYDYDTSSSTSITPVEMIAVSGVNTAVPQVDVRQGSLSDVALLPSETTRYVCGLDGVANSFAPFVATSWSELATGADLATIDFVGRTQANGRDWSHLFASGCPLPSATGGLSYSFDGMSVSEFGFIGPPTIESITSSAGGSLTATDTHGVAVVYTWVDALGNAHYSPPAVGSYTVGGGHSRLTVTLRNLHLTKRQGTGDGSNRFIRAKVYITEANSSGPYLLAAENTIALSPRNSFSATTSSIILSAVPTASYPVFPFDIPGNPGVLAPEMPPGSRAMCSWKNRLWIASADDVRELWYTRIYTVGEAPAFSSLFRVRLDDAPDEITGIAPLGDKLAIFTRTRVYYLSGDGPNDNGTGSLFASPYLVSADVGCVDPRSVVSTAGGVLFESGNGIKLLSQSLQIEDVGKAVQSQSDYYNLPLASCADAKRQRAYFLRYSTTYTGTMILMYDYGAKAWSRYRVSSDTGARAMAIWNSKHVIAGSLASSSIVWQEDTTVTPGYDLGAAFISTVATPWIKVAGMAGFQRVRRVVVTGHCYEAVTLTVRIYTDYDDDTPDQNGTFAVNSGEPFRCEMHVRDQKCAAMQIKIVDPGSYSLGTANPPGVVINSVSLQVGVKQGVAKPMGTNSVVTKG